MTITKRLRGDVKLARSLWGKIPPHSLSVLLDLIKRHRLSIASGDLLLIDGHWYVTHSALLKIAARNKCQGIRVQPVAEFCETTALRYAFRATVYTCSECKGFVGYGDADPSNVSASGSRRRNARGRDSGGQPRSAQSLRHRHLLRRGNRILHRTTANFPRIEEVSATTCKWKRDLRRPQGPRSPLPNHPTAST